MLWAIVSLAAFFGTWFGVAYYGKGQQWSATLRWGGGFLAACIGVSVAFSLLHEPAQTSAPVAQAALPAKLVPISPAKIHNYSLRDGFEYGYERDVSVEERNKGQAASSLMMAKYAGQRDGKYQIYLKEAAQPNLYLVAECTNPCEFLKSMVFFQGRHVSTERMRVEPGIIGWMILEDAINGQLEQYIDSDEGRKFTVWFDEKKGLTRQPIKP